MLKKFFEGVIFFLGLGLFIWLGVWQLERAKWKEEIIYELDREYQKNAAGYALTPNDLGKSNQPFQVVRGWVQGRFIPGGTTLWPSLLNGLYGYQLVDPLLLSNGKILMVNRGWVSEKRGARERVPSAYYLPPVDRPLTVTGAVREVDTNYFRLANDLIKNRWHRFHTKDIAAYLKVEEDRIYPVMMYAEAVSGTESKVLGRLSDDRAYPKNKNRQYAAFWFILSGLWIVILGTMLFRRDQSY